MTWQVRVEQQLCQFERSHTGETQEPKLTFDGTSTHDGAASAPAQGRLGDAAPLGRH